MQGLRRRPRRALIIGSVAAVVALLASGVVFAITHGTHAQASTFFVGPTAGANTGCSSPGYTSVQAAVDAAAVGDTVYLCGAHTYAEQVIVTKAITLTGDAGATIASPNPFPVTSLTRLPAQFASDHLFVPQAIVVVWGAGANVTIKNLHVAGVLPGNGGCAEEEYGILVIDGATAQISGDQVSDIHDSNPALYGCQFGVAVRVGAYYWPTADFSNFLVEDFVGHATVTGTTVSGYQKGGIVTDGSGSTGDVRGNTVNGTGRDTLIAPIIAQNGIQVSRGASGQVRDNVVTGNSYTGAAYASSAGVIVYGGCGDPLVTGVQVMGNTLTNNDVGIYLNNYSADCSTAATTQTNDKAVNNTISNDAVTNVGSGVCCGFPYNGYQAGIDDIGTNDKIINNTITGAGYAARTTVGGPFVLPIDTSSFPTNGPKVHANTVK